MVGLMSQQCAAAWLLVWWCYSWIQGGEGGEICRICPDMLVSADGLRRVGTSSWRRWHKCLIQQKVKVNRSKLSFPVLDFSAWVLWCCFFFSSRLILILCETLLVFILLRRQAKASEVISVSDVFPPLFESVMRKLGDIDAGPAQMIQLRSLQEARYLFSDQKPD